MAFLVRLHVYSGRPDPKWVISEKQGNELLDRIHSFQDQTPLKARQLTGRLGYRGFLVSSDSPSLLEGGALAINDGLIDPGPFALSLFDSNRSLESWLLNTADGSVSEAVRAHVQDSLSNSAEEAFHARAEALLFRLPSSTCTPNAQDAPVYFPQDWNIRGVQFDNNCYNYANDQKTGTYAQPGFAHNIASENVSCLTVQANAQADGLVVVPNVQTGRGLGEGWYVALVSWPGEDFHWYRQDASGCWSHKLGEDPVMNVDSQGVAITNPQMCARGPYSVFCGYMVTNNNVIIK